MNNLDLLPLLIVAHLVGDFLLQNDDMAKHKVQRHGYCLYHICAYQVPFFAIVFFGLLPPLAWVLILAQHYAQDRYALHLRWMNLYGQTPPDRWPIGPLCVDQAMHIAWIAVVCLLPL